MQKTSQQIVSVDEQVGIEKNRCAQMMAAAEAAAKARNFAQAEDLYSACLPIMEQVYAGDSKAMADCLTALGDLYYWQDKFGLALPIYQRLLAMRERMKDSSPASIVTAYFKVAKAQEHLSNLEAARDQYKRAFEIAQKTLMLGHPLLTSVLESYANFLQDKTTNQGLADEMRRKAKTSKETYVDPEVLKSEAMEGKVADVKWKEMPVSTKKDPTLWKTRDEEEPKHPVVAALRKLRKHPRMTIAFLTLPVSLGLLIVTISATYFLAGGEPVQAPLVHVNDVFRTQNAQQSMTVLPSNKISIKTSDQNTTVNYITLSNPWRELQYFYTQSNKDDVILFKNGGGLVDASGNVMEPGAAPNGSTIMSMERLAKGLHRVNSVTKNELRMGKLREYLAQFTYENPYTKQKETPCVVYGEYQGEEQTAAIKSGLKLARSFDSYLVSAQTMLDDPDEGPAHTRALVKCLIVPGEKQSSKFSFFILATDARGTLLRDTQQIGNLLVSSTSGGAPEFNRPAGNTIKIYPSSRVVISKVTSESIEKAAYWLTWILILLPIFAVGYRVFEPRFNRSQYENTAATVEIFLSYLYLFGLAAYICFFTGVVFYVMSL